jgi:hypothetical protein
MATNHNKHNMLQRQYCSTALSRTRTNRTVVGKQQQLRKGQGSLFHSNCSNLTRTNNHHHRVSAVGRGGARRNNSSSEVPEALPIPEPTKEQLKLIMINVGLPFIGFGIMDNAILIIAGDAIDVSLGVKLGISTLCAAAIGNIISDVAGVMLGTVIEDACMKLGLPIAHITEAQRTLRSVRLAGQFGCAVGITVGCILGMFPLFFIDSQLAERKKKAAMINQIFSDVVTEATELVQAENVALFLVKHTESPDNEDILWKSSGTLPPNYKGLYFWAKYVNRPHALAGGIDGGNLESQVEQGEDKNKKEAQLPLPVLKDSNLNLKRSNTVAGTGAGGSNTNTTSTTNNNVVLRVPFGRGVKSKVMRSGEAFLQNVHPAHDPEFDIESSLRGKETRHLLVVPIKNIKGEIIGLIQAVNKRPYNSSHNRHGRSHNRHGHGHGGRGGRRSSDASSKQSSSNTHNNNNNNSNSSTNNYIYGFTEQDMHVLNALASHVSVHLQNVEALQAGNKEGLSLTDTIRSLQRHTTVRPMDHGGDEEDDDGEEGEDYGEDDYDERNYVS